MRTIDEYAAAVARLLPRWLEGRRVMIADLRNHLQDRVAAGEPEVQAVRSMETPEAYAAALLRDMEFEPAPHLRRIGAFLLDAGLGLPLVALAFLVWELAMQAALGGHISLVVMWWEMASEMSSRSVFLAAILVLALLGGSVLLLSFVYFPAVEAIWGTTIGKRLFGLYVVADNGTRVTWVKAIVRRIPFYFEFFWLDALVALFTQRRQRAFDYVAGTVVIRR